jgi:hypothetical protein
MIDLEGVDVGLVVTIGTLRTILRSLNVNGKRWWIASDPHDALETDWITLGHGDQLCTDRLNTVFFRVPVLDAVPGGSTDRVHLLLDASVIEPVAPGYYLEPGRFVLDCAGDFENFFRPLKQGLLALLESAG